MSKLGISTGTVPNDGTGDSLLQGAIKINSNFNEIYTYFGDGTSLTFSQDWKTNTAGIHTTSRVGIGTTNPRYSLEIRPVGSSGTSLWVNGDARVTGIVSIGTTSITLNGITNRINVGSGVTIDGNSGIISATSIVLGGSSITGAGVTSIAAGSGISIDQSTGKVTITATGGGGTSSQWVTTVAGIHTLSNVGVGTTNPTSKLTVYNGSFAISYPGKNPLDISQLNDDSWIIRSSSNVPISIAPNNTSRLTVNNSGISVNGIATATSFTGSGTNLTGIVTSITAGSGISINQSTGNVTITATGGGGGGESYWVSTAAGIHTLSNVGVGTTNPTSKLTVERYGVGTGFGTFAATAGIAHTADSFTISSTNFKTVEYTLHFEYSSSTQAQKVLAMQNGTSAYSQEYAVMYNQNLLVSIGATVNSGQFRLLVTPEPGVNGIVTYRFTREAMI
jgi:hypothetical protein